MASTLRKLNPPFPTSFVPADVSKQAMRWHVISQASGLMNTTHGRSETHQRSPPLFFNTFSIHIHPSQANLSVHASITARTSMPAEINAVACAVHYKVSSCTASKVRGSIKHAIDYRFRQKTLSACGAMELPHSDSRKTFLPGAQNCASKGLHL